MANFSLKLLQQAAAGENVLISPLSLSSALAMLANGTEGESLAELEELLGGHRDQRNTFIKHYSAHLASARELKAHSANSIWYRDDGSIRMNARFVSASEEFYKAEIKPTAFDAQTTEDINSWVSKKTDGQIPSLLAGPPPPNSLLYLINAVSFDAPWDTPFEEVLTKESPFSAADGTIQPAQFMSSSESRYIKMEQAQGFAKSYAGGGYSFVALLPNEGLAMADFVSSLNGSKLLKALRSQRHEDISISFPKLNLSYRAELTHQLQALGLVDIFTHQANLSSMLESANDAYVSNVIHEAKLKLGSKGTKAAAATAIILRDKCIALPPAIELNFNRPFLLMIVDDELKLPIFMGIVNEMPKS